MVVHRILFKTGAHRIKISLIFSPVDQVNKHNIRLGRIFLCFTSNIHQTYDESIGIGAFLIMRTTLTLIDVLRKSKIYISARSFVCFISLMCNKIVESSVHRDSFFLIRSMVLKMQIYIYSNFLVFGNYLINYCLLYFPVCLMSSF